MRENVTNGVLLGDGNLQTFTNPPQSYRLRLVSKYEPYINHLYSIYQPWIGTGIKQNPKTKVYYFNTLTQPELMPFGQDFYSTGPKTLPLRSRLEEILRPETIAYWYMDDGSLKDKKSKGLRICTDGFSLSEVDSLCLILEKKYDIICHSYLNRPPNQYRIYISAKSYFKFKEIVSPYIIPFFQYKLPY